MEDRYPEPRSEDTGHIWHGVTSGGGGRIFNLGVEKTHVENVGSELLGRDIPPFLLTCRTQSRNAAELAKRGAARVA